MLFRLLALVVVFSATGCHQRVTQADYARLSFAGVGPVFAWWTTEPVYQVHLNRGQFWFTVADDPKVTTEEFAAIRAHAEANLDWMEGQIARGENLHRN